MSNNAVSMLKELRQYRSNIEFYLSHVDLGDEEFRKIANPQPGSARATESQLRFWHVRIERLIEYIDACVKSKDTLTLEMLGLIKSVTLLAAHERFEKYEPILERGRRQIETIRMVHEQAYGTPDERSQEYARWQDFIDTEYDRNRSLTYGELQQLAARKFGVGKSTVEKKTKNPKKPEK